MRRRGARAGAAAGARPARHAGEGRGPADPAARRARADHGAARPHDARRARVAPAGELRAPPPRLRDRAARGRGPSGGGRHPRRGAARRGPRHRRGGRDPGPDRGEPATPSGASATPASSRSAARPGAGSATFAHELGHALGLDHARAPTACPRPFRPLACARHPRLDFEYGDGLDVMGLGGDRFGAYALAALGLAPVHDAPAGRAVTRCGRSSAAGRRCCACAPRGATGTSTRAGSSTRATRRGCAPRAARRSCACPRATGPGTRSCRGRSGSRPRDPERPCRAGSRACLARQIFGPGRTFTVPGAFRLRVLAGGRRVRTSWLDRTPPRLTVAGARIVRVAGAAAQLELARRRRRTGRGRPARRGRPGRRGDGRRRRHGPGARDARPRHLRVPLGGAATAQVRLVDAAGNASAPVALDLAALPGAAGATVAFDPPLGDSDAAATPLAAGQVVTVAGRTDPALAGAFVRFEAIGVSEAQPDLPIGADGSFTASWRAPEAGLYMLRLRGARRPRGERDRLPDRDVRGPPPRLTPPERRRARSPGPVGECLRGPVRPRRGASGPRRGSGAS